MRILLTTAVLASAIAAPAAYGRTGYAACVAMQQSNNKLFFTNPVVAEEAATTAIAARFAAMLREKHYASAPELSEYCKFFKKQKDAANFIMALRRNHSGLTAGVPFDG